MKSLFFFFFLLTVMFAKAYPPLAARTFDSCEYPRVFTSNGIKVGPAYGPTENINTVTVDGKLLFSITVKWNNCSIHSFVILRDMDTIYAWPPGNSKTAVVAQVPGSYSVIIGPGVDASGYIYPFKLLPKAVGIEESHAEQANISIYPNPAKDLLSVSSEEPITELIICDLNGLPVEHLQPETRHLNVPVGQLPRGIYLIRVISQTKKYVIKKIVLQ